MLYKILKVALDKKKKKKKQKQLFSLPLFCIIQWTLNAWLIHPLSNLCALHYEREENASSVTGVLPKPGSNQ